MQKIFAFCGKMGAGKDTLVALTSETLNIQVATSFTTRPKREGEKEGREYFFISKEDFLNKRETGEIAEYTSYNVATGDTWYYGLTKEELEKSQPIITIVNPDGLKQLEKIYGDRVISIIIDCSDIERLKRAINREKNVNTLEICRRMCQDDKDFKNILCDYIVDNSDGNMKTALKEIEKIITTECMYK